MDSRSANQLQHTADAAAISGATAFVSAGNERLEGRLKLARDAASQMAQRNSDFRLTALEILAASEDAFGQHLRLVVELEFKPVNPAANLLGRSGSVDIRRRATAEATRGFPLCVLALAEDGRGLYMKSNALLRAEDCIIWSNSTDDGALNFSRGESLAKAFCTAGKARHGYGTSKPVPQEKCRKLPDPLAGFHIPNTGPCEHHKKSYKIGKNNHIKPGVYCDGLRIRGKRVTIDPGVYVVRGGAL